MNADTHLITGEIFIPQEKTDTSELNIPNEVINDKYKRGEIRIITEQARYPLDSIENMLDSKKYILNPEYQRRKRWSNKQKSLLIESFIMNVPIPPIFLYEVSYSVYEVMDGLQRLTAIYNFYRNNYKLEGLEYWKELNGRTYATLPEQVKRGIDRRYLSSIVLLQETAKSEAEAEYLKQIVFERLNSGGEKLTPQETRNALYNGKFNRLCIKLAENDLFRKMWKLPIESDGEDELLKSESYRKMEDVELVLRFFAYRHIDKLKGLTVDKFLDEYLKQANSFSEETRLEMAQVFLDTVDLVYTIFNDSAFLLPNNVKDFDYKLPTKTIYDPIMQSFAKRLDQKEQLLKNTDKIREEIYSNTKLLYLPKAKNNYLFDGRYNNRKDVQNRIEYFDNFLENYIK